MSSNLVPPDNRFRDYFKGWRERNTVNTVPYTSSIPQLPRDTHPLGNFNSKKVTVVGMGQVGLGCIAAILNQDICGTLAMIDIAPAAKKLEGEAKDFQQGGGFHQTTTILASSDYDVSEKSDLVIITAGVPQKPGESRLSLVERNAKIMGAIMPQVVKYSPNATIMIVSNPCDIMTALACKMAGPDYPQGKIFGTGTTLDSSRFQCLIAQSMDLDPRNVHGYIIGEHGDSSVPVWSSVRIGALPLLAPGQPVDDTLKAIHKAVVDSAYDVINLKGYTNWAIGMSVAYLAKAVLNDNRTISPVSTCVRGLYGIEEDVFLALPCSIGSQGVQRVAILPLTPEEEATLQKSAKGIWEAQKPIWEQLDVHN